MDRHISDDRAVAVALDPLASRDLDGRPVDPVINQHRSEDGEEQDHLVGHVLERSADSGDELVAREPKAMSKRES